MNAPIKLSVPPKNPHSVSYFGPSVSDSDVTDMFDAARVLTESWPWAFIPEAETPIFAAMPQLSGGEIVISKAHSREDRAGLVVFASKSHWRTWLEHGALPKEDNQAWSMLILVMDEDAKPTRAQQQEIDAHNWVMPTIFGCPDWYALDAKGKVRSVEQRELAILEVAARIMSRQFHGPRMQHWLRVWDGEKQSARLRERVLCQGKKIEVTVGSQAVSRQGVDWQAMQSWDPKRSDGASIQALNRALFYGYRFSPEGYGEGTGASYVDSLLDIAHQQMGCSVAQLTANQLEIALSDHLYATIDHPWDEELDFVIEGLGRFFDYLQRKYGFDTRHLKARLGHRDLQRRVQALWDEAA